MTQQQEIQLYIDNADKIDLYKLASRMGISFDSPAQRAIIDLFQPENYKKFDTRIALLHRRAGKTYCMSFVLFSNLLKPYFPSAIICPSYKHSKRIFTNVVQFTALVPEVNFKISKSDYTIEVPELHSSLTISSSSSFENNLVGSSFGQILVDEAYLIPEDEFQSMLELLTPTSLLYGTNDNYGYDCKNSHWTFISTPRKKLGATTISNIFLDGKLNRDKHPNIISLALDVSYSPQIDEKFLSLERKRMSKSLFEQEYYVKHIEDENTVFKYNAEVHDVSEVDMTYKGFYSLVLGIDIGYRDGSACGFVLYNEKTDSYIVIDEVFVTETIHEKFLEKVMAKEKQIVEKYGIEEVVRFYDPSAVAFMAMASEKFDYSMHKAKNSRSESIDYANTLFEERADGSPPQLYIHTDCKELKRELMVISWKSTTNQESFANDPTGMSHWDMVDAAIRYALYSHKFYKNSNIIMC